MKTHIEGYKEVYLYVHYVCTYMYIYNSFL